MGFVHITGVRRVGQVGLKHTQRGLVVEWAEEYHVLTEDPVYVMWHVIRDAVPQDSTIQAQLQYTPNTGLPIPMATISTDGLGVCKTCTGERDERNIRHWIFSATWSSEVTDGNNPTNGQPPADISQVTAQRKTLFDVVRRSRNRDYTGRPYVNSAGSLYVPALEVEEEITRWDWTQYEPVYTGGWTNIGSPTSPNFIPSAPAKLLDQVAQYTFDSGSMARVVPPGIYANDTYATMIGVTDNTVAFFNGALNLFPFMGCPPFTLKLEVRDSDVGRFYGVRGRKTDYTLRYDSRTWLDKPVSAGPYFMGPPINASGDLEHVDDASKLVRYDYIYYTRDVETDSPGSQDENGPLCYFGNSAGYVPGAASTPCPDGGSIRLYNRVDTYNTKFASAPYFNLFAEEGLFIGLSPGRRDIHLPELATGAGIGMPMLVHRNYIHDCLSLDITASPFSADYDAAPLGGSKVVKTVNNEWTLRAVRPPTNVEWPYIEYLNCNVFDFNGFLRVRYTGNS